MTDTINTIDDMEITFDHTIITDDNINEYADLLNEMIDIMAKESETYIPTIIDEMAKLYNVKRHNLTNALKTVDSVYSDNNNVVCYFNGEAIKRTTYTMCYKMLMKKIGMKFRNLYSDMDNGADVFMENMRMILAENVNINTMIKEI